MATNAEVVRQIEAAWDSDQLEKLDALFAPNFTQHAAAITPASLEGAKQTHGMSMQAMPDRKTEVLETIAEGDKVAVRVRLTGTNTGGFSWLGIPANGNKVDVEWISIYTLKDGKVTEHRAVMDIMGLMQQLGAIPSGDAVPGA